MFSLNIMQWSSEKNQLCFFTFHVGSLFWLHFIILPLCCLETEPSGGCTLADSWTGRLNHSPSLKPEHLRFFCYRLSIAALRQHITLYHTVSSSSSFSKLSRRNLFFLTLSLLLFFSFCVSDDHLGVTMLLNRASVFLAIVR